MVTTYWTNEVAAITLNRPERHNALVPELLDGLLAALEATQSARAVVLRSEGRSFSTGGDAQGFVDHEATVDAYADALVGRLNRAILAVIDHPAPVIAAVQGAVTGGALGLVLAADIVLVTPAAYFQPFYSTVGPTPDGGWTALLPARIGRARAARLLYLNERLSAQEAVELGLANATVTPRWLRTEALSWAHAIAAQKAGSIAGTKRLLWPDRDAIAAALDEERRRFVAHSMSAEARDGWRAFVRRKHPAIEADEVAPFDDAPLGDGAEESGDV